MRKYIFLLALLFFYELSVGQVAQGFMVFSTIDQMRVYPGALTQAVVTDKDSSGLFSKQTSNEPIDNIKYFKALNPSQRWMRISGGQDNFLFPPSISTIPQTGQDFSSAHTPYEWIMSAYYGNTPPTASITGGTILEKSASNVSRLLNWTAGRGATTPVLDSIAVAGTPQTFSQPSQGGSVSGTQSVSVPANTSTTYSIYVRASDGQVKTASTQFTFQDKIYAGFVTTTSPTSSDIIAATSSSYVGGKLSATRDQSGALTAPSGAKYIMFANPVSMGQPNININGLGVTFNITTISFTNASGFTSNYYIAISPYTTSGAVNNYTVN